MPHASGAARVLSRERLIVLACLSLVCLLCWAWLLREAGRMAAGAMASMPDMAGPGPEAGTWAYFAAASAMWFLMMVAMMLPSAAPMILLYARVAAKARRDGGALAPSFVFAGVYAALWGAFSLAAAGLQSALVGAHVLYAGTLALRPPLAAAGLLFAAGLYQLTPLKQACLDLCRAPLSLLMRWWRPDWAGAARLGLAHGLFCIGCCWALMALLFVGGVMNLAWVAGLAVLVGLEKLAPFGPLTARVGGGLAIAAAAVLAGLSLAGGR